MGDDDEDDHPSVFFDASIGRGYGGFGLRLSPLVMAFDAQTVDGSPARIEPCDDGNLRVYCPVGQTCICLKNSHSNSKNRSNA
eukprot:TRINITY_DN14894_c0_g1_i1.p1 TRINITY_DN14894_c0_g1~~TRINITY_DN14894_c0_g1_i1.p1  ORF type:complete len:97 (+),score=29.64 TRINITY_DN14894_c0_g1_i1:45-293(+)